MNVGVDTRATRGQEFAPRVPMGTTPSPGDTLGGRKVLAVVEGHMDNAKSISSFHPYSAYQNSYPVTAIILERETERKEP